MLFYFAESPFFDRSSENYTLAVQYTGSEQAGEILGTRQRFEATLKNRQGLSYVIAHDPLSPPKQIEAPDGNKLPANVWVIRKQFRPVVGDDSSIEVLRYYYISNHVIYEAPTVAKVLNNRMVRLQCLPVIILTLISSTSPIQLARYSQKPRSILSSLCLMVTPT